MGKTKTLTEIVLAKVNKAASSSKKKGCAKAGRNKAKCAHYRAVRYRSNKMKALSVHLAVHITDGCALSAFDRLKMLI